MNRKEIITTIDSLRKEKSEITYGFRNDATYKKLQKQFTQLELKMTKFRVRWLNNNKHKVTKIDEQLYQLNIKLKAKTSKALDPKQYGDKFYKWWNDLFAGTSDYFRLKQLMWISPDKRFCLVKIPGHSCWNGRWGRSYSSTDWFLFDTNNTNKEQILGQPIYNTDGRMSWIKRAAMETRIKELTKQTIKIDL